MRVYDSTHIAQETHNYNPINIFWRINTQAHTLFCCCLQFVSFLSIKKLCTETIFFSSNIFIYNKELEHFFRTQFIFVFRKVRRAHWLSKGINESNEIGSRDKKNRWLKPKASETHPQFTSAPFRQRMNYKAHEMQTHIHKNGIGMIVVNIRT